MDPIKQLYEVLVKKGLYSKSLEDFRSASSSIENQTRIYEAASSKGLTKMGPEDFTAKFFGAAPDPVKKKVPTDSVSSSQTGTLPSQEVKSRKYRLPSQEELESISPTENFVEVDGVLTPSYTEVNNVPDSAKSLVELADGDELKGAVVDAESDASAVGITTNREETIRYVNAMKQQGVKGFESAQGFARGYVDSVYNSIASSKTSSEELVNPNKNYPQYEGVKFEDMSVSKLFKEEELSDVYNTQDFRDYLVRAGWASKVDTELEPFGYVDLYRYSEGDTNVEKYKLDILQGYYADKRDTAYRNMKIYEARIRKGNESDEVVEGYNYEAQNVNKYNAQLIDQLSKFDALKERTEDFEAKQRRFRDYFRGDDKSLSMEIEYYASNAWNGISKVLTGTLGTTLDFLGDYYAKYSLASKVMPDYNFFHRAADDTDVMHDYISVDMPNLEKGVLSYKEVEFAGDKYQVDGSEIFKDGVRVIEGELSPEDIEEILKKSKMVEETNIDMSGRAIVKGSIDMISQLYMMVKTAKVLPIKNWTASAGLAGVLQTHHDTYTDVRRTLEAAVRDGDLDIPQEDIQDLARLNTYLNDLVVFSASAFSPNKKLAGIQKDDMVTFVKDLYAKGQGNLATRKISQFLGTTIKESVKEVFQEEVEYIMQKQINGMTNLMVNKDVLEDVVKPSEMLETALVTFLGTGAATAKRTMRTLTNNLDTYSIKQTLATADSQKMQTVINKAITEGDIDAEFGKKLADEVFDIKKYDNLIPEDVENTKREEILPLIKKKESLQQEMKDKDSAFAESYKTQIESINAEIKEITQRKESKKLPQEEEREVSAQPSVETEATQESVNPSTVSDLSGRQVSYQREGETPVEGTLEIKEGVAQITDAEGNVVEVPFGGDITLQEASDLGITEVIEDTTPEILNLDTKDPTNLQRVSDFLGKIESDLDQFGKENLSMGLAVETAKAVVKTIKAAVDTGVTLEQAIIDAAKKHNVTVPQIKEALGISGSEQVSTEESIESPEVTVKDAPDGTFLNIEMVAGKAGREMTQEEILDALPVEPLNVEVSGKTLVIQLPRKLSGSEMMKLAKDTEQDAIPQMSGKKGVIHAQSQEQMDKYEGRFVPNLFIKPKKVIKGERPKAGNRLFNEPLKAVTAIADKYYKRVFKGERPKFKGVKKIDKEFAKRISDAFQAMKDNPNDPKVKAAYEALAIETMEQYQDFKDAGYTIEINNSEPYKNAQEMIDDLRDNKRIKIFSTESGFGDTAITDKQRRDNPLLRDSGIKDMNGENLLINDIFRAIHDFYGHAELGNGFGPIGEENAWNVHARMFSPLARRAMTTETRGQNSYVNFSGVNDEAFKLRDKARRLRKEGKEAEAEALVKKAYEIMKFADQKVGLLPEVFSSVNLNPKDSKNNKETRKRKIRAIYKGIPVLSSALDVLGVIEDNTTERWADSMESFIAKKLKESSKSKYKIKRGISSLIRGLFKGASLTKEELADLRRYKGSNSYQSIQAATTARYLSGLIGGDVESARRVHAALDPELYEGGDLDGTNYDNLTDKEKALFDELRSINNETHETNYKYGFISEETYLKYKDNYIGRGYTPFENSDTESLKETTFYKEIYKERKELSDWMKDNKVENPIYLTTLRAAQTARNVATIEYINSVGRTYATKEPKSGYSKLSGKKFGKYDGFYLPNYIVEDVKGYFFTNEVLDKLYEMLKLYDRNAVRQFFKKRFTVYNPVVQLGNLLSNNAFAFTSGVDIVSLYSNVPSALSDLNNKSGDYVTLIKEGILQADVITPDLQIKGQQKMSLKDKSGVDTGVRGLLNRADKVSQNLYSGSDDLMKLAAYKALLKQGYSESEAIDRVYRGFQNYATVGKYWDAASKTPLIGNPFIKFKADLMRIIKNSLFRKPLTTGLFLSTLKAMSLIASIASGEDEDEREIRENRPFSPSIPGTGVPLTVMIGETEVNLARYMSPYYSYEMPSETGVEMLSENAPYQVGEIEGSTKGTTRRYLETPDPILGPIYQVLLTDTDFRGKSIADPEATRYTPSGIGTRGRVLNQLEFLTRSYVPLAGMIGDTYTSITEGEDYYGRTKSWKDIIISKFVKVQQFGDEELKKTVESKATSLDYEIRDIKATMTAINRRYEKGIIKIQGKFEEGGISESQMKNQAETLYNNALYRTEKQLEKLVKKQEEVNKLYKLVDDMGIYR